MLRTSLQVSSGLLAITHNDMCDRASSKLKPGPSIAWPPGFTPSTIWSRNVNRPGIVFDAMSGIEYAVSNWWSTPPEPCQKGATPVGFVSQPLYLTMALSG